MERKCVYFESFWEVISWKETKAFVSWETHLRVWIKPLCSISNLQGRLEYVKVLAL